MRRTHTPAHHHAAPQAAAHTKALIAVPVCLCLAILIHQTYSLCGVKDAAAAGVQDLPTLVQYLKTTATSLRQRSPEAARSLELLSAEIADSGGPKHSQLEKELNETRGYLNSHKQTAVDQLIEITNLKQKSGEQQGKIDQQQSELGQKEQALQEARQQVTEKEQQVQRLEEQLKKQEAKLAAATAAAAAAGASGASGSDTTAAAGAGATAGGAGGREAVAARLHVLEVAGLQCNAVYDQEFWADPLIWGYDHRAQDAAECCAACHAYNAAADRGATEHGTNSTRCNTWSYADNVEDKKRNGECWIKHQKQKLPPPPALAPEAHAVKGWISGVLYPDDDADTLLLASGDGGEGGGGASKAPPPKTTLVLTTALGDIHISLLPNLAPASVRELVGAARMLGGRRCSNCRIYRPEPGFLVQGLLEAPGAYVAVPRFPNPEQPMVMTRGMVCWAGGTGGPHWFVNLVDQAGFKDEHLCWGQVADMSLFDKIVTLPRREKKAGEMNELVDHIQYNITLKAGVS